jgi:hypothetical protein
MNAVSLAVTRRTREGAGRTSGVGRPDITRHPDGGFVTRSQRKRSWNELNAEILFRAYAICVDEGMALPRVTDPKMWPIEGAPVRQVQWPASPSFF